MILSLGRIALGMLSIESGIFIKPGTPVNCSVPVEEGRVIVVVFSEIISRV